MIGMKGIVTLLILKAIRDQLRQKTASPNLRITDCFDLAVGTSTGGIIIGCLCAAMMDLEEIQQLYLSLGQRVFSDENKTSLRYTAPARYADDPMFRILLDLFQTKRLDDPGVAFQKEENAGPDGMRFGFTAVDISTNHQRTLLFRNYQRQVTSCPNPQVPDQDFVCGDIEGTDRCFIVEAIRCTASAPGIIHPYARFYAPLQNHVNQSTLTKGTRYRIRGNDKRQLYTHAQIILDQVPDALRETIRKKMAQDRLMEEDLIGIDGGLGANHPGMLALQEGYLLWSRGETRSYMRVLSIGTGSLPVVRNPTWNRSYPRPLDHGITGQHNYRDVIADLLKYSYVNAATETEETNQTMYRFGSLLASYRRLNPPLQEAVELDDTSSEAVTTMIRSVRTWLDTKEGKDSIDSCVEEILSYSSRLAKRTKQ